MFHGQTAWFSSSVPSKRSRLWIHLPKGKVGLCHGQFVCGQSSVNIFFYKTTRTLNLKRGKHMTASEDTTICSRRPDQIFKMQAQILKQNLLQTNFPNYTTGVGDGKQHEGKVVSLDKAQFVFSDDCQCPDTKRLYESEAYINEHLAIFHSSYVSECVKKEDIAKVVLGNYFLPPLEVMEVIRGQASLAWEKQADQLTAMKEVPNMSPFRGLCKDTDDGVSETEESRITHGPAKTLSMGGRSASQAVSDGIAHRKSPRLNSETACTVKTGSNDVDDVTHCDSLPKVTGILEEFYPGKNGCVVFMKS